MNHPDIETCKAISSEFPESEFVWLKDAYSDKSTPFIEKRKHTHKFSYAKILASAPTCEELGKKLFELRKGDSEFHSWCWHAFQGNNSAQILADGIKATLEIISELNEH